MCEWEGVEEKGKKSGEGEKKLKEVSDWDCRESGGVSSPCHHVQTADLFGPQPACDPSAIFLHIYSGNVKQELLVSTN